MSNFQAGAPLSLPYSRSYPVDLTGGTGNGLDSRVVLVGDPNAKAPNGQWFNRRLQFRFETYNTFNHTPYTSIDTAARFDQNNNQINTNYGRFTNAALARRLVLGLKLYF